MGYPSARREAPLLFFPLEGPPPGATSSKEEGDEGTVTCGWFHVVPRVCRGMENGEREAVDYVDLGVRQ